MLTIYQKIIDNFKDKDSFVILIDGYAGSGKTTFANILAKETNAVLIHMDDFYLPVKQRKSDWFEKAAGNIDFKRLDNEIVVPFGKRQSLTINKFNSRIQQLVKINTTPYNSKLIIEGSYSMHPSINLKSVYKIFMKCDSNAQERRLSIREKDNYINFQNTWIVKELNYHKEFNIEKKSDLVIDTSKLF